MDGAAAPVSLPLDEVGAIRGGVSTTVELLLRFGVSGVLAVVFVVKLLLVPFVLLTEVYLLVLSNNLLSLSSQLNRLVDAFITSMVQEQVPVCHHS